MTRKLSTLYVGAIVKMHDKIAMVIKMNRKKIKLYFKDSQSSTEYSLKVTNMDVEYLGSGKILYDFGEY